MPAYVAWIQSLAGKPVFVAYPAGFDFLFVYWYLIRFAGESPFSHSALDDAVEQGALFCNMLAARVAAKKRAAFASRSAPRRWVAATFVARKKETSVRSWHGRPAPAELSADGSRRE